LGGVDAGGKRKGELDPQDKSARKIHPSSSLKKVKEIVLSEGGPIREGGKGRRGKGKKLLGKEGEKKDIAVKGLRPEG